MNKLYIVGASGAALEVANYVIANGDKYILSGFIEQDSCIDDNYIVHKEIQYPIISESLFLAESQYEGVMVVISVGSPSLRRKIADKFRNKVQFPNIIDPRALILNSNLELGEGNIISPHCVISNNVKVGDFNYFNFDVLLAHDVAIGSYNVVSPRAVLSGNVKIEDECLIGSNSSCRQGVNITSNVTIGIGSAVIASIDKKGTYMGCPVRKVF